MNGPMATKPCLEYEPVSRERGTDSGLRSKGAVLGGGEKDKPGLKRRDSSLGESYLSIASQKRFEKRTNSRAGVGGFKERGWWREFKESSVKRG